ncbi:MAG: hypothetical protein RL308_87 [Bacteroidota bacterium]
MMKIVKIGILCTMIVSSCGTYKESNKSSIKNNSIKFNEGTLIWDKSGKAVYIPGNLEEKDLVYLTTIEMGDSISFKSDFSRDSVNISFYNSGESIIQDSINIRLIGIDNYPIGLVRVDFFKDQELVSSYSPLGGGKKVYVRGITGFIVDIFGAKSDFIKLNKIELKDTMSITFDYLTPSEIEKYTFIDSVIFKKR